MENTELIFFLIYPIKQMQLALLNKCTASRWSSLYWVKVTNKEQKKPSATFVPESSKPSDNALYMCITPCFSKSQQMINP